MASFNGEHYCKLDDKGRVPFPAAFRPAATDGAGQICLIAQKNVFAQCLTLMPKAEWDKRMEHTNKTLNPYNKKHELLRRELFRNMAQLEVDAMGRILLTKKLCESANIGKEVVFAGQGYKIELWTKAEYEKSSLNDTELASLAEELLGESNFNNLEGN